MSLGQNQAWLPPGHLRPPDDHHDAQSLNGHSKGPSRSRTPQMRLQPSADGSQSGNVISESETMAEEDPRMATFRERFRLTEAKIGALFSNEKKDTGAGETDSTAENPPVDTSTTENQSQPAVAPKRPARKIDDDDYDEYDDDEDEDESPPADSSSSVQKPKPASDTPDVPTNAPPTQKPTIKSVNSTDSSKEGKQESLEEIRKKLEEDKKATEEAAKRSFHTMFYTLESDRDAMLDQKRLEESERQVETEMSGQNANADTTANAGQSGQGTLSSANLGASSLTLKNLIARIDKKRDMVQASDAELRSLMSEVRKNRSKWASEERVGQEELYEAAEKVMSELKAMTEHSSAFLTRVNKREAPDYYNIIKTPMDLGTMTKKLKSCQYKSKKEFVDDLNLIWSNCLKYNTNPDHFLRKHALYMRKETEKLVPLIPDIVVRDRAEVEAEERRLHLAEIDGAEESDDEPIMSSRGRAAPAKKSKKGTSTSRKAPAGAAEDSPAPGSKPTPLTNANLRADLDLGGEGSQSGFATPPPGSSTPAGANGIGTGAAGSQADAMDVDGMGSGINGINTLSGPGIELEDPDYKVWKQVTKKDRAIIAADRNRLFKGDKLNPDEPALLRTKAGMRRWLRNQKLGEDDKTVSSASNTKEPEAAGETLAEGIEEEEDKIIPDYYDTMSGIPDLPEQLHWVEDAEGNVVDASEEFLRILPKGSFTSRDSKLSRKMDANMRQMQETRKICSKISIVKQMQLQSQMYQNQFQKYQPEPFVEQDVEPHVMNDAGPVISPWVCKAALQRSVGKIFYHAGFEEFQPSALDAVTDVAADFFTKIGATLKSYMEAPKVPVAPEEDAVPESAPRFKPPYSPEEMILHTISSVGTDVETLESYVNDDVERLGSKLGVVHERMRALLTELLRPAFNDGGGDGSNAFNDGSEQFVGGDFAEDIDEDFFGFKELGLDKELGLASLSVPLHLLQNRMFNAHQAQNPAATQATQAIFPPVTPYPRISLETLPAQIGLVQNFFLAKLHANSDEPLVEDLELPPKQRPTAARPRIPASGKIPPPTNLNQSPQKRPLTAPGAPATNKGGTAEPSKKKAKKNSGVAMAVQNSEEAGEEPASASKDGPFTKPVGKLKLNASTGEENTAAGEGENGSAVDGGEPASGMDVDGPENNDDSVTAGTDANPTSPTLLKKNRDMAATTTTNGIPAGDQGQSSGANATGEGDGGGAMISPESINGQA